MRRHELECDPVIRAVRIVTIEQSGLILIRDDHVHGAAVREIGHSHRASVVFVRRADRLRDINPTRDATIEIDA